MPLSTCLIRLAIAAFLGMLIGIERDMQGRAAGIRTHLLVCVGAALFTMMSIKIGFAVIDGQHVGDPARIAAQIATGIGFLGAGTILKSGFTVRGLTTAAYLWLIAAIGVSCALGHIILAIVTALGSDVLVVAIKWVEKYLPRKFHMKVIVSAESMACLQDIETALGTINRVSVTSISRQASRVHIHGGNHKMVFKSRIEINVTIVKRKLPLPEEHRWDKYFVTQGRVVRDISNKLHLMQPGPLSFSIINVK